jgi:hypothetical protein
MNKPAALPHAPNPHSPFKVDKDGKLVITDDAFLDSVGGGLRWPPMPIIPIINVCNSCGPTPGPAPSPPAPAPTPAPTPPKPKSEGGIPGELG